MKIFQVVPYYPPHIGGMEFYVQRLSELLAARGHEVTVFTSSNSNKNKSYSLNKVKVHALANMTKVYNVPIVPSLFFKLLESEKPDVIHAHQYPVYLSDISVAAAQFSHVPLLIHVHVISDAKSALSGLVSRLYYSTLGLYTLRSADSVIVPSAAYKLKLINMRVHPDRIQVIKVIPYGIESKKYQRIRDIEFFKTKFGCKGAKIILSVGRLNYQKGFQYLIKAMPLILKQIPKAKLIIVGEGEEQKQLTNLSKLLGIADFVIFTGALSQADLPTAYAAADVFVLPSLFESFGISLIEAQASGKPVIGTRTGGTPEALVEGKTGILVEPGNIKQLAEETIRLLLDDRLAHEMGMNGKQFVASQFDIETIVSRVIDCYSQLRISKSPSRSVII